MADIKRYYYLKLKDNFFDSEEIKILESKPEGIYYSNLLIKLYLKSLKFNGALKFNESIAYDENMIATITNLNIDLVKKGLKVLTALKLIERLEDGTIYLTNIQSFIGKSSSEGDRKRQYREKIEEEKRLTKATGDLKNFASVISEEESLQDNSSMAIKEGCPMGNRTNKGKVTALYPVVARTEAGTFMDKSTPEIEIESELKLEKKLEIEIEQQNTEDTVSQSKKLMNYFEKSSGFPGTLNLGALKLAVRQHGAYYVKKAMEIALERNKPTMIYINGILNNWRKEGYPKGDEGDGYRSTGTNIEKCTKGSSSFKPREPKLLGEEEQRFVEQLLL